MGRELFATRTQGNNGIGKTGFVASSRSAVLPLANNREASWLAQVSGWRKFLVS